MKYPAIVGVIALVLVAVGLVARSGDLPYSTRSKEAYEAYRLGMDELNAFRFGQARAALERAVEADPGFAMAQAALANAFSSLGDADRAKTVAQTADSLAENLHKPDERLLVQLQLAQTRLAHPDRRDSLLAAAVERLPRDRIVLDIQAQVAQNRGQTAAAESLWGELLKVDPNYARAYNWLGYLAASKGDFQTALADLRKYAYLAPDLANPHDSLGEILLRIGQYEEAEAELRRALELQPDFYFSLVNLAQIYVETGRVAKGVDLLRKLRDQFAGTAYQLRVDELVIRAYQTHHMEAQEQQAMAEYVSLHPDLPTAQMWRAVLLARQGRPAAALALRDSIGAVYEKKVLGGLEPVRRSRYLTASDHALQAEIARQAGDLQAVVEHRRAVLENLDWLSPAEKIGSLLSLALAQTEAKQWDGVMEQTAAVQRINPRSLPALAMQAMAESALGRRDDARRTLVLLRANLALADEDLPERAVADSLDAVLASAPGAS